MSLVVAAGLATAYLVFKLCVCVAVGKVIAHRTRIDRLSACVAAWLLVMVVQLAAVLVLSVPAILRQSTFIGLALAIGVPVLLLARRAEGAAIAWPDLARQHVIVLSVIAAVLAAFWLRSLFFFDYTWDAQNYGLPRLALWMNYETVFIHMPTPQVNLFTNEWLGEINALCYGLVAGSYTGFAFGNLEVLAALAVAIGWVALLLGASALWALALSAVLTSAPAVIGLASTVKGDLLAVVAFLVSLGWLLRLRSRSGDPVFAFAMLVLAATFAVASKITAVFPALVIGLFGVAALGRQGLRDLWRAPLGIRIGAVGVLVLVSSRFWLNLVQYGDPVKRVHTEEAAVKAEHLVGNVMRAVNQLLGFGKGLDEPLRMWAVSAGMVGATWFVLLVALLAVRAGKAWAGKRSAWLAILVTAILAATLVSMAMLVPYPWTFRYFLPALLAILVILCAFAFPPGFERRFGMPLVIGTCLIVAIDMLLAIRPGEVLPTPDPRRLLRSLAEAASPLERASLVVPHTYAAAEVRTLKLDGKPLSILVAKELDGSLLPFLGSQAQNRVRLVANEDALVEESAKHPYDVVAVAAARAARRRPDIDEALGRNGYVVLVDNQDFVIALPSARVKLTRVGIQDLGWVPLPPSPQSSLQLLNGHPRVESPVLADVGFVSSELSVSHALLIRAAFAGEIASPGSHAAHLSLHGRRPLISLPTGAYAPDHGYLAIVPAGDHTPRRLSFGLGGWGTGKGSIELAKLEAYRLEITD